MATSQSRDLPGGDADLDAALARARRGDDDGFRVLWRALNPRLLRFLAARGAEPDDVASETWLQVVRDLHRFHGDAREFRSWLFTVARNRTIDAHRAAARRPVSPRAHEDLPPAESVDDAETLALEHLSTERAVALVRSLPGDQADAVALRVIAGLDVDTVAAMLGKSPGAVRVCTHRGLRALARRVRDDEVTLAPEATLEAM